VQGTTAAAGGSGHRLLRLLAFIACVAPLATAAQPAPPDDAGKAELVVINDSGPTLIPSDQKVTDNGKPLASLPRQTYARLRIAPGPHQLRPEPFLWKQEVSLDAKGGEAYYVVVAYKPERSWAAPFAGAPLLLKQLSAAEAEALLATMKPR
jgi:hypothetical protein